MSDYSDWTKWLEYLYNQLQQKVSELMKAENAKDAISLRKDYIQKCDEWLNVCDVMRQRIQYARDRTLKQLDSSK